MIKREIYGYSRNEYLKIMSIDFAIEQLRFRGENAIKSSILDRYDILIKGKDIKIKVKFSKPKQRSKCVNHKWEFSKVVHRSRLYPTNIYDYYILVGFNDDGIIKKFWKISTDDDVIYRKNQIFIPANDSDKYKKYELPILGDSKDINR